MKRLSLTLAAWSLLCAGFACRDIDEPPVLPPVDDTAVGDAGDGGPAG